MNSKVMLAIIALTLTMRVAADEPTQQPTITLERVQQRYPWNGLVDIDYTVDLAGGKAEDYYIRFTVATNDARATSEFVLREFLSSATLVNASNGSHRVTWDSAAERRFLFDTNTTVSACLVFSPGSKRLCPYPRYVIIDVSGGASAESYPVRMEYRCTAEGVARYNTDEYKTDKIVLRCIQAPQIFMMGSPEGEIGRESANWMNRETQHQVTLTKDFMIGVFPVTQAQWEKVMGSNPSMFATNDDAPLCPVESVDIAQISGRPNASYITNRLVSTSSFLGQLRARTGNVYPFGLPTEAEWECVCRAGMQTATYFGDDAGANPSVLDRYAWYEGNAFAKTHGVGQKLPNPWGLYDMLGNVWECCQDTCWQAPTSDLGAEPVRDPLVYANNTYFSRRGGSYSNDVAGVRCACREGTISRTSTQSYSGFRIGGLLP